MKKLLLTLACCSITAAHLFAQHYCLFDETVKSYSLNSTHSLHSANKNSGAPDTIPVIFHVVLMPSQMTQIGGISGLTDRINSQLEVLNRDFNAMNADSINIPEAFKTSFGSTGLYFGLAHTDAKGNYTPGYTLVTAGEPSFDYGGSLGSGLACSDVKYTEAGGDDIWSPDKYLNIWVANVVNQSTNQRVASTATLPDMRIFPKEEWGLVLNYGALGRRTKAGQYFMSYCDSGRTLIHETGHYFGLLHTWGLDLTCATDDNIADTPPQASVTAYICPSFPLKDSCSPDSPGVMFMNYMDFASQECQLMFTKDQATKMRSTIPAYYPQLTTHPELLRSPANTSIENKDAGSLAISVYPNPSEGLFTIDMGKLKIERIVVLDAVGNTIRYELRQGLDGVYKLDLSNTSKGIYYVQLWSGDTATMKKVVVM